ncbi:MAG: UDP-N-acetylglucosamine 2-epimerase (hydrolyzing) [Ruminococcaceae bacterium]|nr:UDP-N-acetylglucosamine 2-epimerase (hydrolyzing) [Oscillospiraceae bacterium]
MPKVAVMTGTRADYGLLRPVIRKLLEKEDIQVDLLVTGSHLVDAYGHTIDEIEADGFPIAARLDILSQPVPKGRAGTAKRTALALGLFLEWFSQPENRPDCLLLLGDRYEAFAAGQAAALLDIPLVHISGGDVTYGADDEWFRHCLTKMAKLHFPSCEVYRQRVICMGEQPERVFSVGGLGDENIRQADLLTRQELEEVLKLDLSDDYALVTWHPETQSALEPAAQIDILLAAIKNMPELFFIFTAANADAGGAEINARIEAFCEKNKKAVFMPSLGTQVYLSALCHATVVLGNSSSGVVETPTLKVPAVDIGNRQAGRETGQNVLHCALDTEDILMTTEIALSGEFVQLALEAESPYDGGGTSGKIVDILTEFLREGRLKAPKQFYDGEAG